MSRPSILPLSIITRPCVNECGRSTGTMSGARFKGTVRPSCVLPVVAPSAPGYVPKYESNVRFSLTMNTTCWIGSCAPGDELGPPEAEGPREGWAGPPPLHAARDSAATATTAVASLGERPAGRCIQTSLPDSPARGGSFDDGAAIDQTPVFGGAVRHFANCAGSTGAAGSVGGVANDAWLKSKNPSMGSACASRLVSDGNPNRVSMNFKMDVWSSATCDTKCGREYGETTATGTRNP